MTWTRSAAASLALIAATVAPHAPARADWRDDLGTFRIGIVAESGSGQSVRGLAEIKRAYSMALGIPVRIFVAEDYAALIEAQAAGRLEYAIYSATAYATASELCSCVEPVAAPASEDGSTGFRAVLIARDGRLAAIDDVAKHRVAIATDEGIAGLVPAGAGAGLVAAESASAAEAMLIDGTVDAIFGWMPSSSDPLARFDGGTMSRLQAAGLASDGLSVVWKSDLVRYGPHALRMGLDAEIKASLTIFLTAMLSQSADLYDLLEHKHQGGFQMVNHGDYAAAITMAKQAAAKSLP